MPRGVRGRAICSVDGCTSFCQGRGLCSLHYQRLMRNGHLEELPARRSGQGPHTPLPSDHDRATWVAYAAGFVDGEGCIRIEFRRSTGTHFLKLSVTQLNPQPLVILQSLFGGRVTPHRKTPDQYRTRFVWEAAARQAYDAIAELRPYLLVKADEADVAIRFQSRLGVPKAGGVKPEELAARHALAEEITALKRRSYSI